MAKKIWDKGEAVDQLMHELTVGNDPVLDLHLVCSDAVGSAAHARMLHKVGLLSESDCKSLLSALGQIFEEGAKRGFSIPQELEDVHSAIEARLIERCGEAGRRVHTARSRNDQVLLAVRLFLRRQVLADLNSLLALSDTIAQRFDELADVPLPGYTHMQPAMPSSLGLWLHAWYEGILELCQDGLRLLDVIDSNPLGSGAGFGSSLKIDRAYVAKLLGFARVQRSVIDVNNSRGRYEERYLRWALDISALFEKLACDVMFFCTKEAGFFSLPHELTTGSSIMPQKRNPDVVELLRARPSKVRGALAELQSLTAKLPSSYNRDFQYSKEPLFRGAGELKCIVQMAGLVLARFSVNRERLESSMHDELYATYDACREVQKGQPFRDSYRATAEKVKTGTMEVSSLKKDFALPQEESKIAMKSALRDISVLKSKTSEILENIERIERSVFVMD